MKEVVFICDVCGSREDMLWKLCGFEVCESCISDVGAFLNMRKGMKRDKYGDPQ